jgi:hypothetical protein
MGGVLPSGSATHGSQCIEERENENAAIHRKLNRGESIKRCWYKGLLSMLLLLAFGPDITKVVLTRKTIPGIGRWDLWTCFS